MTTTNNRQIARNAAYLYIRKGVSIVIGLYAARLLLQRLGADDFGLYGVVASIVLMMSALRYLFSDSVQRYVNIAKGRGDNRRVNEIFTVGVNVHLLLSVVFVVVAELCGWFMLPHLNTGTASPHEVNLLFQFSVATVVVSLMTVPYDALIIANERFNAYAVLAVTESVMRLGVIALLVVFPQCKVVWYAALLFAIAVIVRLLNIIYCKVRFSDEAVYLRRFDKHLFIDMSRFAGWNFLGNFGYWVAFSGVDLILNHFGGLIVNAARGIAVQVFSNIQQFTGDLNTSFRPQSMMLYSRGQSDAYYDVITLNTRVNFYVCGVVVFLLALFAPSILNLWLDKVPDYTVVFCRMILLFSLVRSLRGPLDTYFKALGNLKAYQVSECVIILLNLPLSWICLSLGAPFYCVFVIMAALEAINYTVILTIATRWFGFRGREFTANVVTRILLTAGTLAVVYAAMSMSGIASSSLSAAAIVMHFILVAIAVVVIAFFTLFPSTDRAKVITIVKSGLNRNKDARL